MGSHYLIHLFGSNPNRYSGSIKPIEASFDHDFISFDDDFYLNRTCSCRGLKGIK